MEATLNGRRPVTAILPTPVTRIEELRLEILSIDNEESGSLRVDFLGCMEGKSSTAARPAIDFSSKCAQVSQISKLSLRTEM